MAKDKKRINKDFLGMVREAFVGKAQPGPKTRAAMKPLATALAMPLVAGLEGVEQSKAFLQTLQENMYKPGLLADPKRLKSVGELAWIGMGGPGGSGATVASGLGGSRAARIAMRDLIRDELQARGTGLRNVKHDYTYDPRKLQKLGVLEKSDDLYVTLRSEKEVRRLIDTVAQQPMWHGRRTYPKPGESFAGGRFKTGHVGEPNTMSLTTDPGLLDRHFAKWSEDTAHKAMLRQLKNLYGNPTHAKQVYNTQKRVLTDKMSRMSVVEYMRGYETPVPRARVFPVLGGRPSEKLIPAWKGPGTEYGQELLKGAYLKAVEKMKPKVSARTPSDIAFWDHVTAHPGKWTGQEEEIISNYLYRFERGLVDPDNLIIPERFKSELPLAKQAVKFFKSRKETYDPTWYHSLGDTEKTRFNQIFTEALQDKGYKGVMYSPGRYNEFEVRMFDPADVKMLKLYYPTEYRRLNKRLYSRGRPEIDKEVSNVQALNEFWDMVTHGPEVRHSLRDIYKDIPAEEFMRRGR